MYESVEDVLIVLMSGVPVNIPCLTGASVQGTTAPPCSSARPQCPEVGTRCAVLYDEAGQVKDRRLWIRRQLQVVRDGPGTSGPGRRPGSGGGTSPSSNTGQCHLLLVS